MAIETRMRAQAYGGTAKLLHWLIAALLAVQFVTAAVMPHISSKTTPTTSIDLHFSFGLVILAVMALRFVQRMANPVAIQANDAAWERTLARVTHGAFYAFVLVGPFLGWASASSRRLPVTLFGLVTLPDLAAPRARWAHTAGDIHTWMMWTLLGLIGLHVAAVLYHQLVRHDDLLRRMMP
jgi:cytochrome b561